MNRAGSKRLGSSGGAFARSSALSVGEPETPAATPIRGSNVVGGASIRRSPARKRCPSCPEHPEGHRRLLCRCLTTFSSALSSMDQAGRPGATFEVRVTLGLALLVRILDAAHFQHTALCFARHVARTGFLHAHSVTPSLSRSPWWICAIGRDCARRHHEAPLYRVDTHGPSCTSRIEARCSPDPYLRSSECCTSRTCV